MFLGDILKSLELPSSHLLRVSILLNSPPIRTYTASPNVPDLARLNNVVQGSHDLLSRSFTIKSMDLQDIDIRSKSSNTAIHSIEDMLPTQSRLVHYRSVIRTRCRNWRLASIVCDGKIALA